ncbi:MAG TPA: VWA domain-containing protein [Acidimicrobiales bacterium]
MSGRPSPAEQRALRLVGAATWRRVQLLGGQLRAAGVDVGLSDLLDAAEALRHVRLGDRSELRMALRCVLVRHAHHEATFDAAFDRSFPVRPALRPAGVDADDPAAPGDPGAARNGHEAPDDTDLAHRLREIEHGSEHELRILAEEAVDEHGGFDEGVRTERYHVYRVLRAIDLAHLLQDAIRRARERGEEVSREELAARIEELRRLVTQQVRARLSHEVIPLAEGRPAAPFDVEIARASAAQLEEMRVAIRPLARRLAARLRRRRQSLRSGRADMRRTVRRSIATGGVPFDVAYRRPRAHKPEVFSLCDVSGSVADFAGFTLTLVSALADELADTRSFAFVDAIDEITRLVEESPSAVEPWQLMQHGRVIGADGHSDYGTALTGFWERYGRPGLSDRSTVIITGDARTNYRPHGAETLAQIARRCRAVYWLNPEPRAEWDTTDSMIRAYAPHCTEVFEVRTVRQLVDAVERIL